MNIFINNMMNVSKKTFKIYTKTGDKGTSSVLGGKRFKKQSQIFNALGTIDELNSYLGISLTKIKIEIGLNINFSSVTKEILEDENIKSNSNKQGLLQVYQDVFGIQNDLIKIGSHIASDGGEKYKYDFDTKIKYLEGLIDTYDEKLPMLTKFILPGGCESSSFLHLSRTVCRRAERELNGLFDDSINQNNFGKNIGEGTLIYFNRLSDYIFVCARTTNFLNNCEDVVSH